VHHTNEIAQSEGAFKKPLAKYWLHGEFLVIDSKRMGKSSGNFITLENIRKRGINVLAYRYFILGAHYRKRLNFSWEALNSAARAYEKIKNEISKLSLSAGRDQEKSALAKKSGRSTAFSSAKQTEVQSKLAKNYLNKFDTAINDDLNTPRAIAVLWKILKEKRLSPKEKLALIAKFDEILCLDLKKTPKKPPIPRAIQKLVRQRELYRKNKQFVQADALREQIKQLGYKLEDTPAGPYISKL